MKRLYGICLFVLAAATLFAAGSSDGKRWWSYVEVLASDQMQGRETGSLEYRNAADWVADQLQRAGLKPAGTQGFLQTVTFNGRKIVEPQSSLELIRDGRPERLKLGEDAVIWMGIDPAESVGSGRFQPCPFELR